MLPVYLLGNFHCLGMCGPLVAMIGRHAHRYYYFLGRLFSFSLAGWVAGFLGEVLSATLMRWHLSAFFSMALGGAMVLGGVLLTRGGAVIPGARSMNRLLAPLQQRLTLLMLKESRLATGMLGFLTVALPCGQTLVVFSACAVYGEGAAGFLNGACFALLTSPSLFIAMQAKRLFSNGAKNYNQIAGGCAVVAGVLAVFRGLADAQLISHWVLNLNAFPKFHLVIF